MPDPDPVALHYYDRVNENWRFFLEYRHKFLVRFAIAVAAGLSAAAWLHDKHAEWVWTPFAITSVVSLVAYLTEIRTSMMLATCHRVGFDLELVLRGPRRKTIKETMTIVPWWGFRRKLFIGAMKAMRELQKKKEVGADWTPQLERKLQLKMRIFQLLRTSDQYQWFELAERFREVPIGFFTGLTILFQSAISHARILRALYLVSFIFFLGLAVYFGIVPPVKSEIGL